jgi:hypothetical protein
VLFKLLRATIEGDVLSSSSTKFDGKTPTLLPSLPRHQPSSIWNFLKLKFFSQELGRVSWE